MALSRRHCSDCKKCDEVPEREGEFAKKKDDECAALSGVQSTPHDQAERWLFGLFHEAQLADDNIRLELQSKESRQRRPEWPHVSDLRRP